MLAGKQKNTRRILCLLLACAALLTACGAAQPAAQEAAVPTDNGAQSRILRVGVKNGVKKFGYQDVVSGEYSGMEIELAKKLADALGYEAVELTAVTAGTRTRLLENGRLDCVIATFTITPERQAVLDFSTPYYTDTAAVMTLRSGGARNLGELLGKRVGVMRNSTTAAALVEALIAAELLDASCYDPARFNPALWREGVRFMVFGDYPALSAALQEGTVDAFASDASTLQAYLTEDRQLLEERFAPQGFGVATLKGAALSRPIDALIRQWLAEGTIQELCAEYDI